MAFQGQFLAIGLFIFLANFLEFSVAAKVPSRTISTPFNRTIFPSKFLFGASSSSYQYEGAWNEDGKGPSIVDTFVHTHPEKILDRSNGDIALDFYHRYKEDVKLAKFEGLDAFRISIAWTRILPKGQLSKGVNQAGIDHYNSLINEIVALGIKPLVTLFHWDPPQALEDEYLGFLSPKIVQDYVDFVDICFKNFGDRVKLWATMNEPWIFTSTGYDLGSLAPGRCSAWRNNNCSAGNSATEPYIAGLNPINVFPIIFRFAYVMEPPPPPPPPMKTSKLGAAATTSVAGLTDDDSVLPAELIFEILVKLPVKTLLKMRSVSKSWNSVISTPEFVKAHLKHSVNNREFAHHRLLSITSGYHARDNGYASPWKHFSTYSLYAILYGESPCLPVELHDFDPSYEVLGSCDGLFLISKIRYTNINDLFLWNPSIRKLNKLPYSGIHVVRGRSVYGFGYTECQNDYQIVEMVASTSDYLICNISVYSLRRNSWKSIREFPNMSLPKHVKFVKEKLNWITGGGNGGSDSNATWFNPGDEKFGNVALPNPNGDTFKWKLVSSSGNLCMTCKYRNKTDVWIMKEYGLVESWTIVASIPKFVDKVWPIFISHNDEVLLQDVSGLVWWYVSRDGDTFDRPEDQTRCEYDEETELNLYIESLVSPNSP